MKNLLAIDTSTDRASIALLAEGEFFCEEQDGQKTHAQVVLSMINQVVTRCGVSLNQLDGIIFGCGPGSFTGLRIACSVAKGLAYAHDLGLIPVSTLASIAFTARELEKNRLPVLAVLDARMQELYWAYYAQDEFMTKEQVTSAKEIQVPANQPILLAGLGFDLYWEDISEQIKSHVHSQIKVYPSAAAMIRLALELGLHPISADKAQPVYIRNQVTQGTSRG